jgi:phospholipid-translocating ATPase
MGILVRHLKTNKVFFYLKGADVIMKNKVAEYQKGFIMDECEQLAREGLRTLVITQKYLSEDQFQKWDQEY